MYMCACVHRQRERERARERERKSARERASERGGGGGGERERETLGGCECTLSLCPRECTDGRAVEEENASFVNPPVNTTHTQVKNNGRLAPWSSPQSALLAGREQTTDGSTQVETKDRLSTGLGALLTLVTSQ